MKELISLIQTSPEKGEALLSSILKEEPIEPFYYYIYAKLIYKKNKNLSKQYFQKALINLSLDIPFNENTLKEVIKWHKEYIKIYNERFIRDILKDEKFDKKINYLIKENRLKEAFLAIKNSEFITFNILKELLVLIEVLNVKSEILNFLPELLVGLKEDENALLKIASLLQEIGLYKEAIFLAKKIAQKFDSKLAYYLVGQIDFILENYKEGAYALVKALEIDPSFVEAIKGLAEYYIKFGGYKELIELIEESKEHIENICEVLYSYLFELGYCIEDFLKICKEKKENMDLFELATCKKLNFFYNGDILDYDNYIKKFFPEDQIYIKITKDEKLNNYLNKFENIVNFHTIGRGGSYFFHSLMDSHPQISTLPGAYFKGFFEDGYLSIHSSKVEDLINNFYNLYEVFFDASIKKRVPGDPMSGKNNIGEICGLTTLGENRDVVLKIDKEKFLGILKELLLKVNKINSKEFFKILHIAYEIYLGNDLDEKKLIFYHIHNPSDIVITKLNYYYPKSKNLFVIRNWLQSLESWMYMDYEKIRYEKEKAFHIFRNVYQSMVGKISTRIFHLRYNMFISNKAVALKLEDVKNTPEATMKAVADWMGVDYNESLINPTFMGLKFHSNKSKLNPTISEFDKKSIQRKVGVLFSEKDSLLLNTLLRPWNEVFEYGSGEFGYLDKEKAYKLNEEIMDWERKLIDFFEIKEEDAKEVIKYRKQKLKLALDTEDKIFEELKKVELIRVKS